jgi:hypothetical protein
VLTLKHCPALEHEGLDHFLEILRGVILDWLGWTTEIRFCIFKIRWKAELDIDDCLDREEFGIHRCSTTYAPSLAYL